MPSLNETIRIAGHTSTSLHVVTCQWLGEMVSVSKRDGKAKTPLFQMKLRNQAVKLWLLNKNVENVPKSGRGKGNRFKEKEKKR